MVNIDSSYFGNIIIDGKKFNHDVIVDWKGAVQQKAGSHNFTKRELEDLLLREPEVVVIGTGTAKLMKVDPNTELTAKLHGVDLIVAPTFKAIEHFNKHVKRKKTIGIIHVTC